jgi:hypothetical protein
VSAKVGLSSKTSFVSREDFCPAGRPWLKENWFHDDARRVKLDPTAPNSWNDSYHLADRRRRHAGWHRRSENKPQKTQLDPGRLLAIVMGLATVVVILCLVIPT